MDHRISKDMISSGMSYTGEKTQADLGRTQYGSAARPNSLMEAYASMYKKQEIQEGEYDDAKRESSRATEMQRRAADRARRERMRTQPGGYGAGDPQDKPRNESVDLFDLIKGHLMDEGLTEAAAIEMMVSMTEEERESIVEGIIGQTADNIARTAGTVVGTVQRTAREVPAYLRQKVRNVKGTFDDARERANLNIPPNVTKSPQGTADVSTPQGTADVSTPSVKKPNSPSTPNSKSRPNSKPRSREFSHGS